jgi:hypothetical protein
MRATIAPITPIKIDEQAGVLAIATAPEQIIEVET